MGAPHWGVVGKEMEARRHCGGRITDEVLGRVGTEEEVSGRWHHECKLTRKYSLEKGYMRMLLLILVGASVSHWLSWRSCH